MAASKRFRPIHLLVALFLISGVLVLAAGPALADANITTTGPLTSVFTSNDLNCAVNHTGDTSAEFYGGTACATLIATGGTLYGPANIPAGDNASPRTTFTIVSQSEVSGAGTSANPYKVTTVVQAGTSGLTLTQTDSYVVGEESYTTDVAIHNTSGGSRSAILYRAGDCYLQNSDTGFGRIDGAAVSCVASDGQPTPGPGTRIEQWFPISPGSHYMEDSYSTMWAAIGTQANFPDTCTCATLLDNAGGISWGVTVPAGATETRSSIITFSPLGNLPLATSKTADQTSVAAGGTDGYTITVSNPNSASVTLSSIQDTLPAGFTYVPGSSSGATSSDPSISSGVLTWTGSFSVPANGQRTQHFSVTASSTTGQYYNEATATAVGVTVAPTGPTAPVTVTSEGGGGTTTGTIPPGGGTVASPPLGDGVTQQVIVRAKRGTPGGEVVIQIPDPEPQPCPYVCYGIPMQLTAFDTGSASNPLILKFIFADGVFPHGLKLSKIHMFRNEINVPRCTGPKGTAMPDPCIKRVSRNSSGVIKIVALSSDETDPRWRGH